MKTTAICTILALTIGHSASLKAADPSAQFQEKSAAYLRTASDMSDAQAEMTKTLIQLYSKDVPWIEYRTGLLAEQKRLASLLDAYAAGDHAAVERLSAAALPPKQLRSRRDALQKRFNANIERITQSSTGDAARIGTAAEITIQRVLTELRRRDYRILDEKAIRATADAPEQASEFIALHRDAVRSLVKHSHSSLALAKAGREQMALAHEDARDVGMKYFDACRLNFFHILVHHLETRFEVNDKFVASEAPSLLKQPAE